MKFIEASFSTVLFVVKKEMYMQVSKHNSSSIKGTCKAMP